MEQKLVYKEVDDLNSANVKVIFDPVNYLNIDNYEDAVNGHILYVDGGILAYIGKQPK